VIREVAGPGVTIIDSSIPVARELHRRLQTTGLLAPDNRRGSETFWTTGHLDRVRPVIAQLWAGQVDVQAVPPVTDTEERSLHAR
jgi:glutamate racemase